MRVKCLAQEHNTMTPARARIRTTRSGVQLASRADALWNPKSVYAGGVSPARQPLGQRTSHGQGNYNANQANYLGRGWGAASSGVKSLGVSYFFVRLMSIVWIFSGRF